jgi:hypothetical protein
MTQVDLAVSPLAYPSVFYVLVDFAFLVSRRRKLNSDADWLGWIKWKILLRTLPPGSRILWHSWVDWTR